MNIWYLVATVLYRSFDLDRGRPQEDDVIQPETYAFICTSNLRRLGTCLSIAGGLELARRTGAWSDWQPNTRGHPAPP